MGGSRLAPAWGQHGVLENWAYVQPLYVCVGSVPKLVFDLNNRGPVPWCSGLPRLLVVYLCKLVHQWSAPHLLARAKLACAVQCTTHACSPRQIPSATDHSRVPSNNSITHGARWDVRLHAMPQLVGYLHGPISAAADHMQHMLLLHSVLPHTSQYTPCHMLPADLPQWLAVNSAVSARLPRYSSWMTSAAETR
jgi:hypothetical protein